MDSKIGDLSKRDFRYESTELNAREVIDSFLREVATSAQNTTEVQELYREAARHIVEQAMDIESGQTSNKTLENMASALIDHSVPNFLERTAIDLALDSEDKITTGLQEIITNQNLVFDAIRNENIELVRRLADMGVAMEENYNKWGTPLHYAMRYGNINMVQLLTDSSINLELKDSEGLSPMNLAVFMGDLRFVKMFLEHQVNLETKDDEGNTPLNNALNLDELETAVFLLKSGAVLDATEGQKHNLLVHGIEENNGELVKMLLSAEDSISTGDEQQTSFLELTDDNGYTPLLEAAYQGNLEMVTLLLENGANINAVDGDGDGPLHQLLYNEDNETEIMAEIADKLVSEGANADIPNNIGKTPLALALDYDALETATFLIKSRAVLDATEEQKNNLLVYGIEVDDLEIIKILLSAEDSISTGDEQQTSFLELTDDEGCTPLFKAALFGKNEMVTLLLENGTNIHAKDRQGNGLLHQSLYNTDPEFEIALEIVKKLVLEGANVDIPNNIGKTPLALALDYNALETATFLLKSGAVHCGTEEQKNNLLVHGIEHSDPELVKMLLSNYGNPTSTGDERQTSFVELPHRNGNPPLHKAVLQNNIEMVGILLQKAIITQSNEEGNTPLHLASKEGNKLMAKFLLQNHAPIEASNNIRKTPLHLAVSGDNFEMMELLLQSSADLEKRDNLGHTPLMKAVDKGNFEIVKFLLDNGANIQAVDKNGNGLLHQILYVWKVDSKTVCDMAKELIKRGSAVNTLNRYGRTPLLIAANLGNIRMIEILLDNGANIHAVDAKGDGPLHQLAYLDSFENIDDINAIVNELISRGAVMDKKNGQILRQWTTTGTDHCI